MSELQGIERGQQGNQLIPIGGKLPHYLELRTSVLLDCLQALVPGTSGQSRQERSRNRKRLSASLASRARLGMYLELSPHIHLAYADQRDGRNSQHWWRLFFDDSVREKVEAAAKCTAIAIGTKQQREHRGYSRSSSGQIPWSGMNFRSGPEVKIAQALQQRGVLFFANAQGLASLKGLPVTTSAHGLVERLEVDFLVFRGGRCMGLEVDGRHHNHSEQAFRDYAKERVLLREQIPTVRFPAQECAVRPETVVEEFLNLFPTLAA